MPAANDILRLRAQDLARFLNAHRIFFYTFISLVSVSAVITNALKNYSNFYSVAIFLSKSSRSVLVLANFGVLLTLLCGHIVQRIFFGSLRPNEVERLYDRLWFFITESLLAFTIFRDEFDTPFALMFGFLLFVKSFHWLASDRIEWMDQRPYPGPPLLFHFRMAVLFTILWLTDCLMFMFAIEHTLTSGVGGMVLFASEYGILMASVMNTILKYLLSAYDLRRAGRRGGENAPPWENKSMWIFYIELATDFLKLTTYLVFFVIIITFYGLPLNIVRDVYITARSFVTRLRALHRYQTATRNMDQRYPNATEEELTAMSDRTCIICREEMVSAAQVPAHPDGPNTTPKKLPCGHIFHFYCLRSWLERQQSCPTCRRNVLETLNTGTQPFAGAMPGQPPIPPIGAQQPNGLVPPGVQNPQGGNNAMGFFGRFFGPADRPPNPTLNRQAAQNQNNNNQGQPGGHGIFINYQVQYQFPRQPNERNGQTMYPPQQPIPPYPGFPGPGGVWQPWPGAANGAQPTEAGNLDSMPTDTPLNSSPPELRDLDSSVPTISAGPSGSSSLDNPTSSESPREAAARAALSRLGGGKPAGNSSQQATFNSTTAETHSASPSNSMPSDIPRRNVRVHLPQLIPLYDYRSQGANPRASSQLDSSTQHTSRLPPTPPLQPNSHPPSPLPFSSSAHSQSSTSPSPFNPQSSSNNIFSSPLPSSLTEEQLATLDRLTREAIDERLRILEGVSGTIYRCVDDLLRLRSALPQANLPPPFNGSIPSSSSDLQTDQTEGRDASSSRSKGKKPERFVQAINDPQVAESSGEDP